MSDVKNNKLPLYDPVRVNAINCINQIEDLFEYRYKNYTKDELKKEVMFYIDEFVESLAGGKKDD